ncbi:MAG TPA: ATP-binding cassette domain-containing protein, partial [Caulobacteraceae bacterium]|nr:ATP-binding cassette domain-containing protein [Caulobacteraceae bacterium]
MTKTAANRASTAGRPSLGAIMKEEFLADAFRRERRADLRPLSRLLPFVWTHPVDAMLGAFFMLVSSGSILAMTDGARRVIDGGFAYRGELALLQLFGTAVALTVTLALSTGLRLYFTYKLGERVVADMRQVVFRHVLGLDLPYFARLRTGEVLSRLTTDMTMVEGIVGAVIPAALRNVITLVGALGWMVIVSPNFTGFVLVLIPVLLTPLFLMSRRLQRLSLRAQDRFAEAVGYAGEGLGALDTVQAFGQEDAVAGRFNAAVESAFLASRSQLRARGFLSALMILLVFGGMLGLLFQSVVAVVVTHTLTAGRLVQLLAFAFLAANAVKDLSEVWGQIQKASGAASRLAEMIDAAPAIRAPARPTPLPVPPRGEVAFANVRFAYPGRGGPPALNGFTLKVRPGERVALVGPSGAGKSTVLRLLLRFYDPDAGSVRIDGVDLRDADPAQARARLALVAQEAPLFSGSVRQNVLFGAPDASPDDVEAAARAAQASDFVRALPQGFDTVVGEQAKTLSGGQRQRLAIARALLRRSPILLLDEATSALDAENERLVQQALREAMRGRTTLVIAHRLATVLEADRIVVMDEGRVVEEGAHAELLARGGLYAHLARLQFAA